MLINSDLSFATTLAKASPLHGYQSTGLCVCVEVNMAIFLEEACYCIYGY
jgi:hypothetical protein